MRPADVVEEQQRHRGARRALADDLELAAERGVVVVPVQHDRGGELGLAQHLV